MGKLKKYCLEQIVVGYVECLEKDSQQVFLTLIHSPPLEGCLKGGVGD